MRTLAEGDDDAARFVADADPEALTDYTALRNDPGIEEETLREFAQTVDEFDAMGRDRAAIIDGLADAGDDALANFFRFGGRSAGEVSPDVAQSFRRRLVPEYNADRISAEALGELGGDIRGLEVDPQVSGTEKVLNGVRGFETTSEDNFNSNVLGDLYELRTANRKIRNELSDGDATELQFQPLTDSAQRIDFESLSQEQISGIADDVEFSENRVEDVLNRANRGSGPEFDGIVERRNGKVVYYESKAGGIESPDIKEKIIRFKAYAFLEDNINADDIEVVVLGRSSDTTVRIIGDLDFVGYQQVEWEYRLN